MNTQGLIFIAMVTVIHLSETVTANQEIFSNVTYKDIEYLNAACVEADNCNEQRDNDNLDFYTCNCNEFCDQYDTCCVDSKYRDNKRKIRKPYNCVGVYGTERTIFMIDSCDPSWNGDSSNENLCKASAEELDDLFLAVPVTNRKTGITYRNYYCAVCNSENVQEELAFWYLKLESVTEDIMDSPLPEIHFIKSVGEWIVGEEVYDIREDRVRPIAVVPDEVQNKVHDCVPGVIADCHESWTDASTLDKCGAYMAILKVSSNEFGILRRYRNPHCAICNYESLQGKICPHRQRVIQILTPSNTFFVRLFSLYDKESKCDDDKVYDTIAKKCRKVYKG